MSEIASSFASLTPRNDGILEFLKHRHCEALKKPKQSHLLSLEILDEIASSFVSLTPRNDGIPEFPKHRHCEALKKPKQSHLLSLEILNEIASSFASLTPRNDGDLMRLLRSLCSLAMTEFRNS